MQNEFKTELANILMNKSEFYKNTMDICEIQKELNKELDQYHHIILSFFSYNGEAVKLKALYKRLKELDYARNKVIPCVNVDKATGIYNEYFAGMTDFVKDYILEVSKSKSNIELMEKQLQTASQADPMFIDSLFGGKNNESVTTELTEAINNVEFLVDFINWIDYNKETINSVCGKCKEVDYGGFGPSIRLIATSISRFINKVISTAIDTYEDIHNSLDDKPIKTPDATFKLF